MIAFYKENIIDNTIRIDSIEKYEPKCWVSIVNPAQNDIDFLMKELHVPDEFLSHASDIHEISHVEQINGWTLITTRVSVFNASKSIKYYTVPLSILISKDSIITLCKEANDVLFVSKLTEYEFFSISNKANFVLTILLRTAVVFVKHLKNINKYVHSINLDKEVRKTDKNAKLHSSEVQNMMRMEKSLVYFITSLNSNEILINNFQKIRAFKSNQFDTDLLDDLILCNQQAIELAKSQNKFISDFTNSFSTLISNNLNLTMRRLTIFTILLMIPNIFSGFFGMNVPNLLEANNHAFFAILLSSIGLALLLILIFKKKNIL